MLFKLSTILLTLEAAVAMAGPLSKRTATAALAKRVVYEGEGTIYYQDGAAGSCGQVNPDSAYIVALSDYWMNYEYDNTEYCFKEIIAQNTANGNQITVLIADTCASCDETHLDFSLGAWDALTDYAEPGTIEVEWWFNEVIDKN